jgi:dTDP-4-amino-4,6-dideoxygalactose transaminase
MLETQVFSQICRRDSRMDTLQAAPVSINLKHMDGSTGNRIPNYEFYFERLSERENMDLITLSKMTAGKDKGWNQVTMKVYRGKRNDLQQHLYDRRAGCERDYPLSLNIQSMSAL